MHEWQERTVVRAKWEGKSENYLGKGMKWKRGWKGEGNG